MRRVAQLFSWIRPVVPGRLAVAGPSLLLAGLFVGFHWGADAAAQNWTSLAEPEGSAQARVALLLPLSGAQAALGAALSDAAQMAVFDMAQPALALRPYDTGGTAAGAARAAERAVADGAQLLLGPIFAPAVAAARPVAAAAGIHMLAFSNDWTVAGAGTFVLGLSPADQVRRIVSFAAKRGRARLALLIPDTPFGRRVESAAVEAAAQAGGAVVQVAAYGADGAGANQAVRRLAQYEARRAALLARIRALKSNPDKAAQRTLARLKRQETLGELDFDTLLLADGGDRLKRVAPLLPYYDIDPRKVRLLGLADWYLPGLGREPALSNGWFVAPPPAARAAFEGRYGKLFGRAPPWLASIAYDATALAAVLTGTALANTDGSLESETPGAEGRFSFAALTAPHGFAGTGGVFRLLPNGLTQRLLAVLAVRPGGFEVIDPAEASFADQPGAGSGRR